MPNLNFKSIGSGVSEPQVAESRYLPLTGGIAFTAMYALRCYSALWWTRFCDCACCRRRGRSLGNRYGPGTGPIMLDDVRCSGSEMQLGNCQHRAWGYHNCGHSEDVSIACTSGIGCLNNLWLRSLRYHRRMETYIITCPPQHFNEESQRNS